MDIVELGGIRLHILPVHPGLPHEADRVVRELVKLAPAVLLADLDTDDALRMRTALAEKKPFEPAFIDALFADETARRYAGDNAPGEHPLMAAARFARDRRSEFIPVRPLAAKPGFFARRRANKAAANIDTTDPAAYAAAFTQALADARAWRATDDVAAARKRLMRALSEGRAPIVAIVQAHRAADYLDLARATGRIPA